MLNGVREERELHRQKKMTKEKEIYVNAEWTNGGKRRMGTGE